MKKSVIIYLCLTLAAFTFFSCASKETELPENLLQDLSEMKTTESAQDDIKEVSENFSDEENNETAEDVENSETESLETEDDEVLDCDEIEELDEIIEPEVFEEELPPEEPEIISSETADEEASDKETEPLTEEETTEIEELPEVISEVEANNEETESLNNQITESSPDQGKNEGKKEVDEVIEVSDDQADEVESLEESSTDESDKISEENEEVKVIPSRSVTLKKGETLEVSYPGKGWIFLGATDGSKNLTSTGRKTNAKSTDFSLMARVSGTVILHFYKEDILADKYIDDYLEVTVQDIKSKSTVHIKAPSYAETVPAKPAPEKPAPIVQEKTEVKQENETVTPEVKVEKENKPEIKASEPVKQAVPVQTQVPEKESVSPAVQKAESTSSLSADDYLSQAKKALDEKKFTEVYNNIQNFLLITEKNRDEGLFLLAQLYEGNSEYRNIKKSVETYEELTNNYPLSKYWDDANKRAIYLKRFYINIR
ncbi:MAG: hypothetical protein MJ185_08225 [Treponema sp.]|nr:hypothetical protein [Treponema sp.]